MDAACNFPDNENCNVLLRELALEYSRALQSVFGGDLFAVVLFGSVARGEAGVYSDMDILIVASGLPEGRLARQRRLEPVDALFDESRETLRKRGILTDFSPVIKTPEEASRLVPLYFDMTQDADILYEKDGFFSSVLDRMRAALNRLGSRRIRRGRTRYWELKPDYVPNEVFSI